MHVYYMILVIQTIIYNSVNTLLNFIFKFIQINQKLLIFRNMHDNPYLSLFRGFKFTINQQTTQQQAIQISRQLGYIHNATGIIIADLIKCLAFKYQMPLHSNSSTPSTQIKDMQNQSSFQIQKDHQVTKNQNEIVNVSNYNKEIQKTKSVQCEIICDQKVDGKSSSSLSNTEPFQVFEYKNVSKKLQKQFKKIDKQKINQAIQKAKGKPQQSKQNQNQKQETLLKQNKFKIVNLKQKVQINTNDGFQTEQIKKISSKSNNSPSYQLKQRDKQTAIDNQLNKFAFIKQKKIKSTSNDLTHKQGNLNQIQQNLMIQEAFYQDEEYQKIGEDFSFGQPECDKKKQQQHQIDKIEAPFQESKQSSINLNQFINNVQQKNTFVQVNKQQNSKLNDKKQHEVIQILSDDQN